MPKEIHRPRIYHPRIYHVLQAIQQKKRNEAKAKKKKEAGAKKRKEAGAKAEAGAKKRQEAAAKAEAKRRKEAEAKRKKEQAAKKKKEAEAKKLKEAEEKKRKEAEHKAIQRDFDNAKLKTDSTQVVITTTNKTCNYPILKEEDCKKLAKKHGKKYLQSYVDKKNPNLHPIGCWHYPDNTHGGPGVVFSSKGSNRLTDWSVPRVNIPRCCCWW